MRYTAIAALLIAAGCGGGKTATASGMTQEKNSGVVTTGETQSTSTNGETVDTAEAVVVEEAPFTVNAWVNKMPGPREEGEGWPGHVAFQVTGDDVTIEQVTVVRGEKSLGSFVAKEVGDKSWKVEETFSFEGEETLTFTVLYSEKGQKKSWTGTVQVMTVH